MKSFLNALLCVAALMLSGCGLLDSAAERMIKSGELENLECNKQDGYGHVPLFYVVKFNLPHLVEALYEKGASLNYQDSDGLSPVHWAVKYNVPEVLRELHKHGASVNKKDEWGHTPLHLIAAYNGSGREELCRLLLKMGADPTAKDRQGHNPLYKAAKFSDPVIFRLLLDAYVEAMGGEVSRK